MKSFFDDDKFDKRHDRFMMLGYIMSVVNLLVGIGVTGFICWLVFKLFQHFGVL